MKKSQIPRYTKAGAQGGRLIRQVLALCKAQELVLPIQSYILIAVSGGSDSVGLAHLLVHLGRKIAAPANMAILHVNHGWRAEESNGDEAFVRNLGKTWGIPVVIRRLPMREPGAPPPSEESARQARKKIFAEEAQSRHATILTAHQADDVAETILWRLFTGAARTHGGGVKFREGHELRICLTLRKSALAAYLAEVQQAHREDHTNLDRRYLRAKMRATLMPEVERIFPRAIDHLLSAAFHAQKMTQVSSESDQSLTPAILFHAAGVKVRRPHLEFMLDRWMADKAFMAKTAKKVENGKRIRFLHLAGGWRLSHERGLTENDADPAAAEDADSGTPLVSEKWVLEKVPFAKLKK